MAWGLRLATVLATLVILSQVQMSMQLPWNHPLRRVVDRVNQKEGPFIGLVMAFGKEEMVLIASGHFTPSPYVPAVQIAGRVFNIGTVKDVPTIYVMTGEQIANAAMTMQILYDTFDIVGVVHYGIAGAVNASLNVGDVVIPDYVAYSNSWHWINNATDSDDGWVMTFGNFSLPEPGQSLLGQIEFNAVELYTEQFDNSSRMNETFWIQSDPAWFNLSLSLKDVELDQCLNWTSPEVCTTTQPTSHFGLKGSTSNVYLANVAFRDFTYRTFNFSIADEETAAVVQTSVSNNKPCVVFRGISDLGGGTANSTQTAYSSELGATLDVKTLAAYNCMKMSVAFIELFGSSANLIRNI